MRYALLLLLLTILDANAYTFSCEQVKKLIIDKTTIKTTNACVSLDEFIVSDPSHWTNEVYFEDGSARGGTRYSFAEVATIGCASGFAVMPDWTIVTDREDQGQGIDCSYEFTVFFSSIETILETAKNDGRHHHSYRAYNFTVVAPRGGILIDFSCNNTQEPLNFYTGLGNGAGEEMFYYGSSKCDERLSVFAWDTAITINVPNDGYIDMTYFGTGGYLSLGSVSYDVILLGSGKSNAIVQHGEEDKFMWLSPTVSDDLKFHIDGFVQFDPQNANSLVFSAQCKQNNCTGSINPLPSSGDIHIILEADFLAIDYFTHVPDDQWKNSDMFFLRIATTPLDASDPPPTLPPTKPNTDYTCGCELTKGKAEFSSSLWLDIIFIVDVSKAMGTDGINKASLMIDYMVNSVQLGNILPPDTDKFSRVAIITASNETETINSLSTRVPYPLTLTPSTSDEADIGSAIQSAILIFSNSPRSRPSTPQLIYIISASDSSNTDRFSSQSRINNAYDATYDAEKFKMKGGIIAVTDVSTSGANPPFWFSTLASPGYYNIGFNEKRTLDLQLLCDANCFCSSGSTAFNRNTARENAYGGCYHSQFSTDPYLLAKEACQAEGALLSTIHDQDKQYFLMQVVSSFGSKTPFWIGNEYNGNEWEWIDDSKSAYSNWNAGQPDLSQGRCAISKQTVGFNSGWFTEDCSDDHLYICERAPCGVNRYCP